VSIQEETASDHEFLFCPRFQAAIELVGRRWTGAIVRSLFNGPQRFNALLGSIPGLSDRLLAGRLKELESQGLLRRQVAPGPPVCVSYELTDAGRELQAALDVLGAWAERWIELPKAG
jgi:DNA-binding HxlR family transcriptional regulator